MADIVVTSLVILALAGITAAIAAGSSRQLRPWVWLGLAEYMICAAAQLIWSRVIVQGGDTVAYSHRGAELARFLDENFNWSGSEMLAMLLQQPSAFDPLIETPESNTGSMFALAAWLFFILRSEIAAQVFFAGLSFFGALSINSACRSAFPEAHPVRLFAATVLFPSVAFWTAALHKESVCIVGIGLLFAAWRAGYRRQLRAADPGPGRVLRGGSLAEDTRQ